MAKETIMTKDETFDLPSGAPVFLIDGCIGMFLVYPIGKGDREGICGIQVPGEDYHRWIHHDNLSRNGNTLIEI